MGDGAATSHCKPSELLDFLKKIMCIYRDPGWLSQLSICLDLSSDLNLRAGSSSPVLGPVLGVEPT